VCGLEALAARYRRFADVEAAGRSPLYQSLAAAIADDAAVLEFLMTLPAERRQPNLLLAAWRHLHGTPESWEAFRARLLAAPERLAAVMRSRRTQTNEPARCAALLPLLARLPQPLALLEVGASAGLCLLPDRYAYDYGPTALSPPAQAAMPPPPRLVCRVSPEVALPTALPRIVWRAGLDIAPLNLADPQAVAWLETLVWPGQEHRLALLRQAVAVARACGPPRVVAGDLRYDLPALAAQAPREATLVVFHTAVLAYVANPADRAAFARAVGRLPAAWIAAEAPGVLPGVARPAEPPPEPDAFLVTLDGVPRAWARPHGTALWWIGEAAP
jgi:hypothetical protein